MYVDKNLGGPPLFAGCGAWGFARRRRGGFVPSGCGGAYFVFHWKKRRCFLLPRKDRLLSPLAACLTNPGDDSRTNTCRCQKNIICGYHQRMRSSAALTETCPSGTVRNTPFLRLEHEIRPPQPEGTKLPRRLRAKPPAPQPAKRGGPHPPTLLSTSTQSFLFELGRRIW